MNIFQKTILTDHSKTTIIIRIMVGAVFLSEGIQKFIYPVARSVGRFEKIGFVYPEFWGYFVGVFEIACGAALLIGFLTRAAAFSMLIDMSVSILITKIPILFGHGILGFSVRHLDFYNFWSFAHEIRTDFAMWFGSLFLLFKGSGRWAIDSLFLKKRKQCS